MSESESCRRQSDPPLGTGSGLREKSSTSSGQPRQSEQVSRFMSWPKSFACIARKEAWERAHQTAEFKTQFQNLPIERHTLSSASFFEVAYAYQGGETCAARS
jgi:hypothetical protein